MTLQGSTLATPECGTAYEPSNPVSEQIDGSVGSGEKGRGGEGLGRGWGARIGLSRGDSGGTAAWVGNGGRGPGVSSDGRRVGGPGLRASGSPKSDRNIHLESLRPPPRTETGPKRKDTAGLLGTGGLTLASRPPSDVTPPGAHAQGTQGRPDVRRGPNGPD